MSQFPILFSVTQTGAITEWQVWTEGPAVHVRWGQQGGVKQIDTTISLPKNFGKRNATTAAEQAVKDAKSKWDKQKRRKYHESIEAAQSFDGYKPMLAATYGDHKHKLTWPVFSQPKLNGLRSLIFWKDGRVVMQSRGNKEYYLEHIKESAKSALQSGLVLDGEIYKHGMSLQDINSLARKPREESKVLRFWVFDIVNDDPQYKRVQRINDNIHLLDNRVLKLTPTLIVKTEEALMKEQAEWVGAGYEGAMVRTWNCPYKQGGRSTELLKLKDWIDDEFTIVGMKEGKDGLPVFICGMPDGRTFDARPKGNEKERLEMKANIDQLMGKMLTVKYFDLTDSGLPHFGVGLGIREDE